MPLWSPALITEYAIVPIPLIIIYTFIIALNIANYTWNFRNDSEVYGESLVRAYLAFIILGTILFLVISGPCWILAAKYCTTADERLEKISYGIYGIFVFHDAPLLIIQYHAIESNGWFPAYRGFVFIVQFILFIMSFIFGWLNYTWMGAKYLEVTCGEVPLLRTGAETLNILPPPHSPSYIKPLLQSVSRVSNRSGSGSSHHSDTLRNYPTLATKSDHTTPSTPQYSPSEQHDHRFTTHLHGRILTPERSTYQYNKPLSVPVPKPTHSYRPPD